MTGLRLIGGKHSHELLRAVLSAQPPCRVLDAPSGTGVLAVFLRERGWDVQCADIDPGHFRAEGIPFERVDLNRTLPFADASFDTVVCANGLHRLYRPAAAIREFQRVLRPGGHLHITINNYASIAKRLRFLFCGSITNTINEDRYEQTIADAEANVRHHLFFPQLANLLEGTGFEIVRLQSAAVRPRDRVLLPVAWSVRLATYLARPSSARRHRLPQTRSGAILSGGKYLYVEAVKRPAAPTTTAGKIGR